jgi:hypothetical protein
MGAAPSVPPNPLTFDVTGTGGIAHNHIRD